MKEKEPFWYRVPQIPSTIRTRKVSMGIRRVARLT